MPATQYQSVDLEARRCSDNVTYIHSGHVYFIDVGYSDNYYYCPGSNAPTDSGVVKNYIPILDDRRLPDQLPEARRVLSHYRLMLVSGNENPVRRAVIEPNDIVARDTVAFFETWP